MERSWVNAPELGVVLHDRSKSLLHSRISKPWRSILRRSDNHRSSWLQGPAVLEWLRSVATSLLLGGSKQSGLRVIAVVSAGANEGKTAIVPNVGLMLANTGRRVLLIDGDLQRGGLHTKYSIFLTITVLRAFCRIHLLREICVASSRNQPSIRSSSC
jgi:Mrp family chromosome partitioning ATPase